MAVTDLIPVSLERYIPDFGLFGEDNFDDVYESYEAFYRQANMRGRDGKKAEAAAEFYQSVVEYVEVEDENREDAESAALFARLSASGLDLTEEKLSEEELRQALEGELE
ncbi:MAG: hypothetical protein ABEJ07_03985 [Candidatus Nanohaloarchaea archaeon]